MTQLEASSSIDLRRPCQGYVPWELSGGKFLMAYPFGQHGVSNLSWDASTTNGGRLFSIRPKCKVYLDEDDIRFSCEHCLGLEYSPELRRIVERTIDPHEVATSPLMDSLCSIEVMGIRRTNMREAKSENWLKLQNMSRRAVVMVKSLTLHKRLVVTLAQNDLPKLRQLLSASLKHGCSGENAAARRRPHS